MSNNIDYVADYATLHYLNNQKNNTMPDSTHSSVVNDRLADAIAYLKDLHFRISSKVVSLRLEPKVPHSRVRDVEQQALGVLFAIDELSRHSSGL